MRPPGGLTDGATLSVCFGRHASTPPLELLPLELPELLPLELPELLPLELPLELPELLPPELPLEPPLDPPLLELEVPDDPPLDELPPPDELPDDPPLLLPPPDDDEPLPDPPDDVPLLVSVLPQPIAHSPKRTAAPRVTRCIMSIRISRATRRQRLMGGRRFDGSCRVTWATIAHG
jgi:hypothetical protein